VPELNVNNLGDTITISPAKAAWLRDELTVAVIARLRERQLELVGMIGRCAASGDEQLLRAYGVESLTIDKMINLIRVGTYIDEVVITQVQNNNNNTTE